MVVPFLFRAGVLGAQCWPRLMRANLLKKLLKKILKIQGKDGLFLLLNTVLATYGTLNY